MRMGVPRVVLSDQGTEFNNSLNDNLAKLLGIERRLSTPYYPQTNGLDERFNQTLQGMLVKLVHEKKEKWSDVLDGCVFAYNTSVQDSTKYTPFQLMFGRQATLPIDVETVKATPEESVQAYASLDNPDHTMVTEARLAVLQRAKENILEAQKKQKKYFDQKHAKPEIHRFSVTAAKCGITLTASTCHLTARV